MKYICQLCEKERENDGGPYELANGDYCCQSCLREPDDDDEEHYDMDKAQEESDAMDAESHLLQVDEPEL